MNRLVFLFISTVITFAASAQQNNELLKNSVWLKKNIQDTVSAKRAKSVQNLLNFNEHLNVKQQEGRQAYKSVVNRQSSLFVVYKTADDKENDLLLLQAGVFKTIVTNKKLISDTEEIFNKADPAPGAIISHVFNRQSLTSRKKGKLSFSDALYNDTEGKNTFYEMIYLPKCVSEKEKNSIESYLSIKYGISLIGEKYYTNSSRDTIWNYKENEAYKSRVTGIGRDDFYGLNQKQSGNSTKDGVYISLGKIAALNYKNNSLLKDKTFLLWGDNNLKTTLKGEKGTMVKMQRAWKAKKVSGEKETLVTQVIINKKEMQFERGDAKEDFIWLVMDTVSADRIDYNRSAYIRATTENDSLIVFDKVKWSSPTTFFTLVRGPEFMVNYELNAVTCTGLGQDGGAQLTIIGGTAPYTVKIASRDYNLDKKTDTNSLAIEGLKQGNYTLVVSDASKKTYKDNFVMDGFAGLELAMADTWYLDEGKSVKINPDFETDTGLVLQWSENDKPLHEGKDFSADKPGQYTLTVTNDTGCVKKLPFTVLDSVNGPNENYTVYPNPCKHNQTFTVTGSLKAVSDTTITITDMNGRIVLSKSMGPVKDFTYNASLNQSATYNVIITSGQERYTTKLIIN